MRIPWLGGEREWYLCSTHSYLVSELPGYILGRDRVELMDCWNSSSWLPGPFLYTQWLDKQCGLGEGSHTVQGCGGGGEGLPRPTVGILLCSSFPPLTACALLWRERVLTETQKPRLLLTGSLAVWMKVKMEASAPIFYISGTYRNSLWFRAVDQDVLSSVHSSTAHLYSSSGLALTSEEKCDRKSTKDTRIEFSKATGPQYFLYAEWLTFLWLTFSR